MSTLGGNSLLDFLEAPVVVGDPVGRVIYANPAFEEAFNRGRREVSGVELASVFSGGAREAVLKAVADVCARGQSSELRLREDGRAFLGRVSPIETGDDRVGVIILLTDEPQLDPRLSTYQREITETLAESASALDELLEQTGGRRSDRYRQTVEKGLAAVGRAQKWAAEIQSLLAGAQAEGPASIDPVRVLREAESRVADDFSSKAVELDWLAPAQLPAALGNAELLQTAVVRLLRHRLAAARPGGFVTVAARCAGTGDGRHLLVTVIDPLRGERAGDAEVEPEPRSVRDTIAAIGGRMKTIVDSIAGRATVIELPLAPASGD